MRETRAVRLVLALACAAALLGLGACGGGGEGTVPEGAVLLRGAGATYPAPLYKAWFETFEDLHRDPDGKPRVVVDYDATGSGTGEKRFLAKAVDFGASDAGWRSHDKELAALDRGARLIPMTAGSVVVIYNLPGFAGDLCFSRQVLADIFLGKIRSWSHPDIARDNPGVSLPKLPITVSTRADGSGTTVAFTNHLSAISEEWKNGPGYGEGDRLAGRRARRAGERRRGRHRQEDAGRDRLRRVRVSPCW
jgi:phosphate transport system substrate-binding protein